jgi:hypothetical protein
VWVLSRKGDAVSDQGQGLGQPDYGAGQGQGAYAAQGGMAYNAPPPGVANSSKGFVASLFDFGFSSFVTPKVVKVVYVLITILVSLATIGIVVTGFRVNLGAGIFFLVIVAPLFFFIYLALWRIALEIFILIFRIGDDIRTIRDRGIFTYPR